MNSCLPLGGLGGNWPSNQALCSCAFGQSCAAHSGAYLSGLAQQAQQGPFSRVSGGTGAFQGPPKDPLENTGMILGEIIGWRMWNIHNGYLQSYSANRIWAPGEPMTGKPSDYGGDGVWAFKERSRAIAKMHENAGTGHEGADEGRNTAYGAVAMWGEIVEHQLGYRSEFARIVSLDDAYNQGERPIRWWRRRFDHSVLAQLRKRYQVSSFEDRNPGIYDGRRK